MEKMQLRDQGAQGRNVKGAGSKDPSPNIASLIMHHTQERFTPRNIDLIKVIFLSTDFISETGDTDLQKQPWGQI